MIINMKTTFLIKRKEMTQLKRLFFYDLKKND